MSAAADSTVVFATFAGSEHFAACVAHELRTPLATQRALLELVLADPSTDAATWREIGEEVLHACRHQERLVDACLVLAQGQGRLQRCEPVDLAAIAAEALRAQGPIEIEQAVTLEPAWTAGDPDLLERLAANVVSNAIRHNIVDGRIEVATRGESGRAVLSVANTGALIPAGELRRLFQPFQRLNAKAGDGFGLGLPIVRAIANAHGALVSVRSRAGGGLEMSVSFPAALTTGGEGPSPELRSRPRSPGPGERR